MTLAHRLAAFVTEAEPPESARAVMRQSLYDWMACGMAGATEPVAEILRDQALTDGGVPTARLFGGGEVPSRAAALVNGTISHALDYDDTHFAHIGHPSVAVCPAAWAVGQGKGEDVLDAALVGAEVSVRVGLWLGRDHYQRGFHQTATAGAFGATAAVARLRGLTVEQTAQALAIAATRAAGLKSQFGTMGKPLNAGLAAETGIVAADLAARGFISNPDALDGPQGFGPTHHGAGEDAALERDDWLMETVSHKLHACCHGLHAMIEALGSLRVTADQVERVAIRTHPRWMTVCNIAEPKTALESKFSYRQTAAMVLTGHDTAAIAIFNADLARHLAPTRQKVTVTPDDTLAETEAHVTATLLDGETREATHDLAAPIPVGEKWSKLRRKGRALVGDLEEKLFNTTSDRVNVDAVHDLMG